MAPAKRQPRKAPKRGPMPRWSRWLLSTALVLWAFVLGVLVGQGVIASPEQIQWFMKTTGLSSLAVDDQPTGAATPAPIDLTFYDNLQDGETVASSLPGPKKTTVSTGYYVQVASFKVRGQALELKKRLSAAGHPAQMVETKVKGLGTRFRVRVGAYSTKAQADQAMETFRTQYNLAGLVIKSD